MIDLKTLKETVKIETEEEREAQRREEYLRGIEEGVVESYRIGLPYYTFNVRNDLYDSHKLKRELKALGYTVEMQREFDSWYMQKMPSRITVRWGN